MLQMDVHCLWWGWCLWWRIRNILAGTRMIAFGI
jgi:hypothetical protein